MTAKPTPIDPAQIAATLERLGDGHHGPPSRWDAPIVAAELSELIEAVVAAANDGDRRVAAAVLAAWSHDSGWERGVAAAAVVIAGDFSIADFSHTPLRLTINSIK